MNYLMSKSTYHLSDDDVDTESGPFGGGESPSFQLQLKQIPTTDVDHEAR